MKQFNIASIFDGYLDEDSKDKILLCLYDLYQKNYIDTEILLNIIKAFVLISAQPRLNGLNCDIYSEILMNLKHEEKLQLFSFMKRINMSKQMYLTEGIINKIILTLNSYIMNNYQVITNIEIINNIINYYNIVNKSDISFENKIQLFNIGLKKNLNPIELKQIIVIISKITG